ncbi:MAG TPA: F0F1 ATP synthase subunit delta [Rhodanobacteraceae bacterium]
MAEALTLARPYARAAFELARDAGSLDAWSDALAFAAKLAVDPQVAALRNDPRVQADTLVAVHLPVDQDASSPFARLIAQMAEHDRLALLPDVAELFDAYKREAESVLKVSVTTAMALDDAQAGNLKAALKRRYQRDIELVTRVDADLLGGAIIDADGEVIDGSARGRLAQLASALAH